MSTRERIHREYVRMLMLNSTRFDREIYREFVSTKFFKQTIE